MRDLENLLAYCKEKYPPRSEEHVTWMVSTEGSTNDITPLSISLDECVSVVAQFANRFFCNADTACGAILVGWLRTYAETFSAGKSIRLDRQFDYEMLESWSNTDPDDAFLWFEMDRPTTGLDEDSNNGIAQILNPPGRKTYDSLDPSKSSSFLLIAMPPITGHSGSLDCGQIIMDSDWATDEAVLCDLGECLIREYFQHQSDSKAGDRNYLLYLEEDKISDRCIGAAIAYDFQGTASGPPTPHPVGGFLFLESGGYYWPLSFQKAIRISSDGNSRLKEITILKDSTMENKGTVATMPISHEIENLLKGVPATFLSEPWVLTTKDQQPPFNNSLDEQIFMAFCEYESQTVSDLLKRIYSAGDDIPSLSDAVKVYKAFEASEHYRKSALKYSHGSRSLASIPLPIDVDPLDLSGLPYDYIYKKWEPAEPSNYNGSYGAIGKIPLEQRLMVMIEHFDSSTTLIIAEELLAFEDILGNPSAYFCAILFLYLSQHTDLFEAG